MSFWVWGTSRFGDLGAAEGTLRGTLLGTNMETQKGPIKTTVPLKWGYMGFHVSLGECTFVFRYWSVSHLLELGVEGVGSKFLGFGAGGFRIECLRRPVSRASTRFGTFPKKGAKYRPPNTIVFLIRTPKKVPNLGKLQVGFWNILTGYRSSRVSKKKPPKYLYIPKGPRTQIIGF